MEELVTIRTFTYPHELVVLRARLESEGIPCFTKNEINTQVHPFSSNAYGGIILQVRDSDLEVAVKILEEQYEDLSHYSETTDHPGHEENSSGLRCPVCSSGEISKPRYSQQAFAIGILLIGFPFIFFARKRHCFNCGLDFRPAKSHSGVNPAIDSMFTKEKASKS